MFIYFAHKWPEESAFNTITEARKSWAASGIAQETIEDCIENLKMIKIGETRHAADRGRQLAQKENLTMSRVFKFQGSYADALFLESYVRSKIERHFPCNCRHLGNDHFRVTNTNIIRYIDKHFLEWCEEGLKILEGM